ncbi:MAG: hemolysin family protein [Pseudobdellovibrionaceae bacterium]|jgi:CBS domain containing-hemolysin-like protein|nr:hemolysin family protein [Pseudobdellovibrionaceae bacterium]
MPTEADKDSSSRQNMSKPNEPVSTGGVVVWLKNLLGAKPENDESLREVLEEYIEEMSSMEGTKESAASHELQLLSNILELRDRTAEDVMVPRIDIVAIDLSTPADELLGLLAQKQHVRIPVYRETLDDIVGVIHIKDVFEALITKKEIEVKSLVRDAPVVSPAMPVFDLLMMMRQTRQQMVFVVDEYGGIDGLVTIGDVVSSIIGEVQDEFDKSIIPEIVEAKDGSFVVDARIEISDFEEKFGQILSAEERDVADTLGGFIFTISGRVPARGEVITHEDTGFVFEIMDADPRRVTRIRVRHPKPSAPDTDGQSQNETT